MLISEINSVSLIEIELMRDILYLFFPAYKSKTYEEVAFKMNEEFNRDDISGKILFYIDEPSLEEECLDAFLNSKQCNYE